MTVPADKRLYPHFEGRIKVAQFEEYKKLINDIRESASKAGSDFWCPASDGEKIIHNEAFANEENFKRHMNEWVPTISERLGQIAEINKIRTSGPVTEEQKAILERFGAELGFYDNY